MAYTQDQYQALVGAIAQGALRVKYADKEIQYHSLADMERLKKSMELDLGIAKSSAKSTLGRKLYPQPNRGL